MLHGAFSLTRFEVYGRLDVKSMNKTCYKVIKFNSPDLSRDIRLNKSNEMRVKIDSNTFI